MRKTEKVPSDKEVADAIAIIMRLDSYRYNRIISGLTEIVKLRNMLKNSSKIEDKFY